MPPKQRITREMIMERAFEMFCLEGMDVVNARSVAKALGCSTQPIFSYYTGMQELRSTIDEKAQEMFAQEVLTLEQSESWLIDLCMAFVSFACNHPHVYRHLYESACADSNRMKALDDISAAAASHIAQKENISEETAAAVCRETVIYAVGLASVAQIDKSIAGDIRAQIEKTYTAFLSAIA